MTRRDCTRGGAASAAILAGCLFAVLCGGQAVAEETFKLPRTEPIDWSLYPKALGILGNHQLMHPIDVGDWPLDVSSKRQLFIDDHVVHTIKGFRREFHRPVRHPDNPLVRPDKPWERTGNEGWGVNLDTVLRDPKTDKYMMWYDIKGFDQTVRDAADNNYHFYRPICYAESDDGIRWRKPSVGIYKFKDYPGNNILHWRNGIVFLDPKERDPSKRFKSLFYHRPPNFEVEGLYLYASGDGIHWRRLSDRWVMPIREHRRTRPFQAAFRGGRFRLPDNGVNNVSVYYDANLDKYVGDVKYRISGVICTGRTESDDMIHWSNPVMTLYPDAFDKGDQLYYIYTFPYESVWLGLVRVKKAKNAGFKQVDIQLAISHDGRTWSRTANRQTIIPLGDPNSWEADYNRIMYHPIVSDKEIRFYYSGSRSRDRDGFKHNQFAIGLATLRRDGFVSLNAGDKSGTVLTRPLTWAGRTLLVNAEVAPGGYVKAAVLDIDGKPVRGYGLDQCRPMRKDTVSGAITWAGAAALPAGAGMAIEKHLRLRFEVRNAKLYSFRVE